MIELNKQYRYKNKVVVPMVIEGGNIICFDSKGATVFVKKESDLTKIEEENKIVEPAYIKEPVKAEEPKPVEVKVEELVVEEKKAEPVIVVEPVKEEIKIEEPVVETKDEEYDDFYEVKTPSIIRTRKKRVNVVEKNEYI